MGQGEIRLSRMWLLGDQVGSGGFGKVFAAQSNGQDAVVKLIPKDEGADRELLFVNLTDVPNVIPIIDSGETDDYWVIVMPRADKSLREHLQRLGGALPIADAAGILKDICDALVALDGRVVHRDLKPENVLFLNGKWCLADFGISRYAEATTAPDTQKYAMSPLYTAPERWRNERATSAADIYSFGVIAFELIMARRPFEGSSPAELRNQHLHVDPPPIEGVSATLSALIDECLFKAPEARPSAANVRQRLERMAQPSNSPGLSRLQEVNLAEVRRRTEEDRIRSAARSAAEQRSALADAAQRSFERISTQLKLAIAQSASTVYLVEGSGGGWDLELRVASLKLASMRPQPIAVWGQFSRPVFDVVCTSSISLRMPSNRYGYEGRSHSLWYCDAVREGEYCWFETAFMLNPILQRARSVTPFAWDPGPDAGQALSVALSEQQVAWPFTPLVPGDLDEFVDRWAGLFADAVEGRLSIPRRMPERDPAGSWRTS